MPREQPVMAELFEREKQRQLRLYGDALAERLGRPPGAKRMSDAALVERYLMKDPKVTPEMIAQMQAEGATPDDITRAIHPYREATWTVGVVGTEEQLKEAKRIAHLAEKHQAKEAPVDPSMFLSDSLGSLMPQPPSQPMLPPGQPEPMMVAEPSAPEMPMQEGGYY
jgi:hypothetical protein